MIFATRQLKKDDPGLGNRKRWLERDDLQTRRDYDDRGTKQAVGDDRVLLEMTRSNDVYPLRDIRHTSRGLL